MPLWIIVPAIEFSFLPFDFGEPMHIQPSQFPARAPKGQHLKCPVALGVKFRLQGPSRFRRAISDPPRRQILQHLRQLPEVIWLHEVLSRGQLPRLLPCRLGGRGVSNAWFKVS